MDKQAEHKQPQYYQAPAHHNDDIRRMQLWLGLFFGGLLIIAALFIANAHRILVHLPFSVEQRFVKPYERMGELWRERNPSSEQHQVVEQYLQQLAEQLAIASELPADYPLTVHFLDNDTVNAFASLGGHVFVCRGLLESVDNENSLAMVMAHEIAHIQHRDPAVSMGRGLALQMMYSFATGDYSRGGDWVFYGGDLGLLYFSREQERAADNRAIATLQQHYGHIAGHSAIFEILAEQQPSDEFSEASEWLQSHPKLEQRISSLQQQAEQQNWSAQQPTALPTSVLRAIADLKYQATLDETQE
jgi:predicted Zn-dependent protease